MDICSRLGVVIILGGMVLADISKIMMSKAVTACSLVMRK